MSIYLIIALVSTISIFLNFFLIRSSIKKSKEIKELQVDLFRCENALDEIVLTENQKTEIREKHSEKQAEILNSDKPISTDDIMPVTKKDTKKTKFSRTGGRSKTIKY